MNFLDPLYNKATQTANTGTPNPTPQQENPWLAQTQQEIDGIYPLFEFERFEEVITICNDIHAMAVNTNKTADDIMYVKDMLLEAGFEIALNDNIDVAQKIWQIADSPATPNTSSIHGVIYHEAGYCWRAISAKPIFVKCSTMVIELKKAISNKPHLKSTTYFVGQVFQHGSYRTTQNLSKAATYICMAQERGYKPNSRIVKKQTEYGLMLLARQEENSAFFNLPTDVIRYISRLRVDEVRAKQHNQKNALENK